MVRIYCPQCQTNLPAADAMAGVVVPCSRCGTLLRVPGAPPEHGDPGPQEGGGAIQVSPAPAQPWSLPQDHPEAIREGWGRAAGSEALPEAIAPRDAEVLAELERLQNQRPGWWRALGILAVSLLLYVGAAQADRAWDSVVILVAVLAFHEFGHYVAMRCFG